MIAKPSSGRLVPARMVGEIDVREDVCTARLRERRFTSLDSRDRRPLTMGGGWAFASRPMGLRAGRSVRLDVHHVHSRLDPSSRPGLPGAAAYLNAQDEWIEVPRVLSSLRMVRRQASHGVLALVKIPASAGILGRSPSGKGVHAE